jgi:SAM-dependent methyltransferase
MHFFERQELTVEDFEADGYVLDIGGGGEGIIGRMKPRQVVAIDLYARELQEAPAGPLKIVMDASDLKFLDGSFNTVTSFFTLMFVKPADHEKVFREVSRVLRPGGRFLIWDPVLPARNGDKRDIIVIPLTVKLPDKEVKTGYGTFWPDHDQDMAYYAALADKAGLKVQQRKQAGQAFYMELIKP